MSTKLDVVTFGEAMVLLVAEQPGALEAVETFHKRSAGAETNVAIGLARLGLKVGWASRLGTDSMGRYLLAAMAAEGIDCSKVQRTAEMMTGFMLKGRVTDGNDPPVEYYRKGSAASHMGIEEIDHQWMLGARHLHATGVFAAISASTLQVTQETMDSMLLGGKTVSFDPNLRPSLWASTDTMRDAINGLATRADWVLPGISEGRLLTQRDTPEEIADFYRQRGAKLVVVKLGAQGAYFDGETGSGYVDAYPVAKVIDTVGAGDGFAAGLISGLLEGRSVRNSVQRAAWVGACAVQVVGDSEGLPTRSQLLAAGF